MTTAEMATYAYDQIDQARTELNAAGPRRRRTKTAVTAPVAAARTQPATIVDLVLTPPVAARSRSAAVVRSNRFRLMNWEACSG